MNKFFKFTKMHGLGNDFIFTNEKDLPEHYDIKKIVNKASKRHTGIGCDQFILYREKDSLVEIEIYNSDGSKAEACGNATRCLAYLLSRNNADEKNIKIFVDDRILECHVGNCENVSVNMGEAKFEESWMPSYSDLSKELLPYLSSNSKFLCVDIGNPHLVIIDQNLSREDKELLGPRLEKSSLFPSGVNVNFASLSDNAITLKVWERGAGFTYACGSGACASFAACHKLGFVKDNAIVKFDLGELNMSKKGNEILMAGSVALVAEGVFYYE